MTSLWLSASGLKLRAVSATGRGLLLLAIGYGRHRHPHDSAGSEQTAYTYYFAQAITSRLKNLQLSALRIKHLASPRPLKAISSLLKAQSHQQKDPHPLFIFHNVKWHLILRNTPVTFLGPLRLRRMV